MLQKLREFSNHYCGTIRYEADQLRDEPMPLLTEELFAIYENTGNRLIYEGIYFLRRKYLAVFGMKSILDREEKDVQKLEAVISDICEEECWALPAHVNRGEDSDWRIFVDLFAAETAQALSEIVSVLSDVLSEAVIQKAKDEVFRRVLNPFSQSKAPYASWEYGDNNWCAVCGGAVGSAAIYMIKDEPAKLDSILRRISYAMKEYYMSSFTDDGACIEGLGYFTYGMTYFTGFAAQLYDFTEGRTDLFQIEKLKQIAAFQSKCYFASGMTVSFSDGFSSDTFRAGLTCYLAMKYPEAGIPPMDRASGFNSDNCYRWMSAYRDLIWTRMYMEKLEREEIEETGKKEFTGQVVLPSAQWSICQSRSGAGMAAKGGHNGEPHNHNDVGSFFYIIGKDLLLTDFGSGEYTREYFSDRRYEFLCCRSLGHNVPIVNDREQLPGTDYYCCDFSADGKGRTEISFAPAYAIPGLDVLARTLDWDTGEGTLKVEDQFYITEEITSVKENLVTEWKPEVAGNTIRIRGKEKGCLVTVEDLEGDITCIVKDFSDHSGIHHDVYLLQWKVPGSGTCTQIHARFTVMPED